MKLTMLTSLLKEMVSKSIKGASNNKMIPRTSLMCIKVENGQLVLITTDATNYLYIKNNIDTEDGFYAVVPIEQFSKLVARMTCDNITLSVENNVLNVRGNGNYLIELPLDEEGNTIIYPDPMKNLQIEGDNQVKLNKIITDIILTTCKPSLAVTMENPCYTRYYVGDCVIATDTYKISSINSRLWEHATLISSELMDLLSNMTSTTIDVYGYPVDGTSNFILFTSPECDVYGIPMEDIEDYAVGAITELINDTFTNECSLPKSALVSLLDRLSLFVTDFDKNTIYLTFTETGLKVESKSSNGCETIEYISEGNFTPFTCCIDVEMFKSQIKAQSTDTITLQYGKDNAIKLIDGNITCIVSLLEDDRIGE